MFLYKYWGHRDRLFWLKNKKKASLDFGEGKRRDEFGRELHVAWLAKWHNYYTRTMILKTKYKNYTCGMTWPKLTYNTFIEWIYRFR